MSYKTIFPCNPGILQRSLGAGTVEGEGEGDAEQEAYLCSLLPQPQLLMQLEQVHSGSLTYFELGLRFH